MTESADSASELPAMYARHCAGALVEPRVNLPEALNAPETKRSSDAAGSTSNVSAPFAETLPSI
jgi:hypothetical protein